MQAASGLAERALERCPMMPDLPPLDPAWQIAPLAYVERLDARPIDAIALVVIHCTELPDLAEARVAGERALYPSGTGNSGHFYIDRDGQVHVWVPLDRVAHHVRGHNAHSVGIELVNRGRYPDWLASGSQQMDEPYPPANRSPRCDPCFGACSKTCRTCARSPVTKTSTPSKCLPATIRRGWCSASVIRALCFPWPEVLAGLSITRIAAPADAR
jgi:hypothetical protein